MHQSNPSHQTHPNVVFSIYPNTRGFGYVVLENPRKLINYGTATIRPVCNCKALRRAKNLIDYYKPMLIVVQDYDSRQSRHCKRIKKLIDRIVAYGKEKRIVVKQYSREQIQDVFAIYGAKSKYQVSQAILKEFTELKHHAPKPRKTWQSPHPNMAIFDALSLALTHYYLTD